jgi:polyhydroxybutyrate depolymerase
MNRGRTVLAIAFLASCAPVDPGDSTTTTSSTSPSPDGGPLAALDGGPSAEEGEDPPAPGAHDGGTASSNDAKAAPAPGCSAAPLKAGTQARSLTTKDGAKRSYDLYVPKSYTGKSATAVVFYFHPLGTNKYYHQNTGGPEKAEKEGFLAVFAQGLGASWNAGACCGPSNGAGGKAAVDDVGFVRAILAELQTLACVDGRRVYATGFSNGGFLSHKLACDAADLFAAVVPVGAVNGVPAESCKPLRPVPVFMMNGTTDLLVPYKGGFSFPGITQGKFISAEESFSGWATRNGCGDAAAVSLQKGKVTCKTHTQCKGGAEVTLCTVEGGGHCWFGELICFMGTNNSDLKAIDASWEFLKRFTL